MVYWESLFSSPIAISSSEIERNLVLTPNVLMYGIDQQMYRDDVDKLTVKNLGAIMSLLIEKR